MEIASPFRRLRNAFLSQNERERHLGRSPARRELEPRRGTSPLRSLASRAPGAPLYVSIDDGLTTGIEAYDLSEPRSPKRIHFLSVGDRLVGNAERAGRYLYFTQKRWLYVYDALDPANPGRVREIEFNALVGEVRVHRGHLFVLSQEIVSGEEGGRRLYSLADPPNPRQVAY